MGNDSLEVPKPEVSKKLREINQLQKDIERLSHHVFGLRSYPLGETKKRRFGKWRLFLRGGSREGGRIENHDSGGKVCHRMLLEDDELDVLFDYIEEKLKKKREELSELLK